MSDAEAKRKRIDEENISTADLAGARTDSATDRQANRARAEDVIDVQPQARDVRAVEVQKTEVTAQAVPVRQAGETAARTAPARFLRAGLPAGQTSPNVARCFPRKRPRIFAPDGTPSR